MSPDPKREPTAKRSASQPWHQRALQVLTNWCLFAGGVSALAIGAFSAIQGEATLAGIAWGAGVLLLLGATIDRFESLKGLGIEAKTRQIDDKLAQADEALERIRELAELVGTNLVFLHSKIGRWGGPSAAEGYVIAQEVKENLTRIGSSESTIRTALEPWVRTTCGDILSGLARGLSTAVSRAAEPLHLQRSGALMPSGVETAESLKLKERIELASGFLNELASVRSIELSALPEAFLKAYDQAPEVGQAEVAALRRDAEKFMPVVLRVRDDLAVPDPGRWCPAIDQLLERAALGG